MADNKQRKKITFRITNVTFRAQNVQKSKENFQQKMKRRTVQDLERNFGIAFKMGKVTFRAENLQKSRENFPYADFCQRITILFSLAIRRTNRPACPVSAISNLSLTPPPSPINQSSCRRRWQRVKERLQQIQLGDIFSIRPCLPLTMMSSLPKECPGLTGQLLPGPLYGYP